MKALFTLCLIVLSSLQIQAQCKTYLLNDQGDTVNCTDNKNFKQGKWHIRVEPLRGEPGYIEIGKFKDDKREGAWTKFNMVGDVMAKENYRWGFKHGTNEYYSLEGLIRKESWKAIDPKNPYDTVNVYDLANADKITQRVMKAETFNVRHGIWENYNPSIGMVIKREEYNMDMLVPEKKKEIAKDLQNLDADDIARDTSRIPKPAEVLLYEKKNSNKKNIKVRDGRTGVN